MECTRCRAVNARGAPARVSMGLLLGFLLVMAGCSGGAEHVTVDLRGEGGGDESNPAVHADLYEGGLLADYYLEVGDHLRVDFFFNPELSRDLVIRPDGQITLPGIGDFRVAGHTPRGVAQKIEAGYSDILLEPAVTVTVTKVAIPKVYVIGMVLQAGGVEYRRSLSVTSAIAEAGGPKDEANLGSVVVIRRVSATEISAVRLDLGRVYKGNGPWTDEYLQPYDIVYVPRRFVSHLRQFALDVAATVIPTLNTYYLRKWRD